MAATWRPGKPPKPKSLSTNPYDYGPSTEIHHLGPRTYAGYMVKMGTPFNVNYNTPTELTSPYANMSPNPAATGPYVPPPPQPKPLIWSVKYGLEGSPDWWQGLVANKNNPYTQYVMAANAWLPFLSPEDQRAFSNNISLQWKGKGAKFGDSTDFAFGTIPSVSPEIRTRFMAADRANAAVAALQRVANTSGFKLDKLGKGYQYLKQVADALRDFGSTGRQMSRLEYTKFIGAIDPLLNQKGSEIEPYVGLAKAFLQPFLTGGSLMDSRKLASGGVAYGSPNPLLYT